MRPQLIYQSIIAADDTIKTLVFPGRDKARPHPLSEMSVHARTRVSEEVWQAVAARFGGPRSGNRKSCMDAIERVRGSGKPGNDKLCDAIAQELYAPLVKQHISGLPASLKKAVQAALQTK